MKIMKTLNLFSKGTLLFLLTLCILWGNIQIATGQNDCLEDVRIVEKGNMVSFGNYDGVYIRSHAFMDCDCWIREDGAYAILNAGNGGYWHVFRSSTCPTLTAPMSIAHGFIGVYDTCEPADIPGIRFPNLKVENGNINSFGNYDGEYECIGAYQDCECWRRTDGTYSIGRISGYWHVFESSTCPPPLGPISVPFGTISASDSCDPTTLSGISVQ